MKQDKTIPIEPPAPCPGLAAVLGANRERLLLWGGIALCVIAAVAVRAVFLFKDAFATGFDGYYYALQVKSLIKNGVVLNRDNSIVFYLLRFFAFFFSDVVLANKIGAILLCSLAAAPFYLLARRLTASHLVAFVSALFLTLSFSQVYMAFEIVKNGVSMLFVVCALYCLARFFDRHYFKAGALVFFALGFFTHKAAAGLLIVFAFCFFAAYLWLERRRVFRKWKPLHFAIGAVVLAAIAAAVVFSVSTLRLLDVGNFLRQITPDSVLTRFKLFITEVSNLRIKVEYLLLYIIPLAFLPFLVKRLRDRQLSSAGKAWLLAAYLTQWVLLNPFLSFTWISTSYRLLFAALEIGLILADLTARARRPVRWIAAGVLVALILVSLPGMYERFHTGRYPPYADFAAAVKTLKSRVGPEDKLISQQGLSFFIWYETGIYTQHFLPEKSAHYYRLVYGLGPAYFQKYWNASGYEEPVVIQLPYVLVKEEIWQLFFAEYKDRLKICTSWQNPSDSRPAVVYGVKSEFERRFDW
jgi:hypothetical protein